ncbi:MAG: hypothetical protein HZC28_20435 [Spirochaetes bacterium]|nr:hypothetical protein [Spirochaetota bacterium]
MKRNILLLLFSVGSFLMAAQERVYIAPLTNIGVCTEAEDCGTLLINNMKRFTDAADHKEIYRLLKSSIDESFGVTETESARTSLDTMKQKLTTPIVYSGAVCPLFDVHYAVIFRSHTKNGIESSWISPIRSDADKQRLASTIAQATIAQATIAQATIAQSAGAKSRVTAALPAIDIQSLKAEKGIRDEEAYVIGTLIEASLVRQGRFGVRPAQSICAKAGIYDLLRKQQACDVPYKLDTDELPEYMLSGSCTKEVRGYIVKLRLFNIKTSTMLQTADAVLAAGDTVITSLDAMCAQFIPK